MYLNAGCPSLNCRELGTSGLTPSSEDRHRRRHLKGSVETPNSFQRHRANESVRPTTYMPKLVALNPSLSEKEKKKKGGKTIKKTPPTRGKLIEVGTFP